MSELPRGGLGGPFAAPQSTNRKVDANDRSQAGLTLDDDVATALFDETVDARYVKSCPGIGVAAAEWLARQDPMLVGSDNWPVEVAPNPDPQISLPVHQILLVVNGIHLLENMKLDELTAKRVYDSGPLRNDDTNAQGVTR
ncbi:MAG: hypothetical protein ACREKS_21455 [Candidatus Rokuibacteriota bacterium]